MHRKNIAHRDLKLDNYLLTKSKRDPKLMDIKVSDFGLSRVHFNIEKGGMIYSDRPGGTPQYKGCTPDVWALGVSLYLMLFLQYPFEVIDINVYKVIECMDNKRFSFPKNIKISPKARDLIERTLDPYVDKRPWL